MDEPLGFAVGNSLEVIEAIHTLDGRGPDDLLELCLELGSRMAVGTGAAADEQSARKALLRVIDDKSALRKLAELVKAQGGDERAVYDTGLLPSASIVKEVRARVEGYVQSIDCERIGACAMLLGGGRETKESVIDLSVGIVLRRKVGERVADGDVIAEFHANDSAKLSEALARFEGAYVISDKPVGKQKLIKHIVED